MITLLRPHALLTETRKSRALALAALTLFAVIGTALLVISEAATPTAKFEAESGTRFGNAAIITDASASGGSATKFTATVTGGGCATSTPNVPDGPDPWGGCWPGPANTGYPRGLPGDTRSPVTLTNYTGACTIRAGATAVIDSKNVDCSSEGLFVYGTLTVKNSYVKGIIYQNSETAVLTVIDSEVDGGNQGVFPTLGGANNITVTRVNAYGGQHTIQCYGNCVVEDSYLHDQFEEGSEPHQNAFLSNSGENYTLRHNTTHCTTTGCTANIAFTDDGVTRNAVIDKNLLMPTPGSYCMYPGTGPKNNPMYQFTVTNNVFKRGANNKCATYGPVYAWDAPNNNPGTSGYQNVWSNNKWEDGTVINP